MRMRHGKGSTVRTLVGIPDPTTLFTVYVQKDVVLRPAQHGQPGQHVSRTVTYEPSGKPSSEPLDLPELLEIPDNDNDKDLSKAMEEEFFGHAKRAEPAEPKRDPVGIFTSQIDADTDRGNFRIDQSKIGCHIVRNMSMNSWPMTPLGTSTV